MPTKFLDAYARLGSNLDRSICFVESEFAVERALACGFEVLDIIATPAVAARLADGASKRGVPIAVLPSAELKDLVGFPFHRGCIARAVRPVPPPPPAAIAGNALVLDRVTDPVNVGAIVRTARAFGVTEIIAGPGCADPFERRAIRASMGCVFSTTQYRFGNRTALADWLRAQHTRSTQVLGTALGEAQRLTGFAPAGRWCLIVGNEGHGIAAELAVLCDATLRVEMEPGADSLNVGAATAIVLHWLCRAHRTGASSPDIV